MPWSSGIGTDTRRAPRRRPRRRWAAMLLVVLLAPAGCGHSTKSSARTRGCENALDGMTATQMAHGRSSILVAARAEARTWAALTAQERRHQIAACTARGGAPTVGR